MADMIASQARIRAERYQPDPDDYEDEAEYEAAYEAYWEEFEQGEADYYEGLVDAARDDALFD